jgi:hypothetical protein
MPNSTRLYPSEEVGPLESFRILLWASGDPYSRLSLCLARWGPAAWILGTWTPRWNRSLVYVDDFIGPVPGWSLTLD